MFAKIRRLCKHFFNKSRKINNEPINKVSLIVVIIIDIFIFNQCFSGLDDIGRWYLAPSLAHPCYFEWVEYRDRTTPDKDYAAIRASLQQDIKFQERYQQVEQGHLGEVSPNLLELWGFKRQS
jgi:hypothetical protein